MNVVASALAKFLQRLQLRCALDPEDQAAVTGFSGRVVKFGASQDIVRLGERIAHCCLVADGMMARFGQTEQGLRQITAFYLPGDMGDLHSAVLPRVTAPLQSAKRATIVFVPHGEVLAAAARSPNLSRALWRDCVVDAQIASEWMLNAGRRTAEGRVAHLLSELAVRYEKLYWSRSPFPMDFTQIHLAEATGLTPVHVNRTLRRLREAGALTLDGRNVTVIDWAVLTQIAGFDPAYLHMTPE